MTNAHRIDSLSFKFEALARQKVDAIVERIRVILLRAIDKVYTLGNFENRWSYSRTRKHLEEVKHARIHRLQSVSIDVKTAFDSITDTVSTIHILKKKLHSRGTHKCITDKILVGTNVLAGLTKHLSSMYRQLERQITDHNQLPSAPLLTMESVFQSTVSEYESETLERNVQYWKTVEEICFAILGLSSLLEVTILPGCCLPANELWEEIIRPQKRKQARIVKEARSLLADINTGRIVPIQMVQDIEQLKNQ
jgi:hypothetical protein